MTVTFFYFGYGSNLLAKRIHIQNPAAQRIGVGKLIDHRLDFYNFTKRWNGAAATVVPSKGDVVYGAIWEIDSCHIKDLDDQEGVHINIYKPATLPVYCENLNKSLDCRLYYMVNQPPSHWNSFTDETIPFNRQPSKTYLKTLIKGALESGLPSDYVAWLRAVKHNSNSVEQFEKYLDLASIEI